MHGFGARLHEIVHWAIQDVGIFVTGQLAQYEDICGGDVAGIAEAVPSRASSRASRNCAGGVAAGHPVSDPAEQHDWRQGKPPVICVTTPRRSSLAGWEQRHGTNQMRRLS
jgi:hypothetical protein